jgi:hypothetical protein
MINNKISTTNLLTINRSGFLTHKEGVLPGLHLNYRKGNRLVEDTKIKIKWPPLAREGCEAFSSPSAAMLSTLCKLDCCVLLPCDETDSSWHCQNHLTNMMDGEIAPR